jgi:uncharacterized protein (TIGR02421 family)
MSVLADKVTAPAEERPRRTKEGADEQESASTVATAPPSPAVAPAASPGKGSATDATSREESKKAPESEVPKRNGSSAHATGKTQPSPGPLPPLGEDDPAPSIPPMPAAGPWRSYKEVVAQLATRIVEAQRPIRVLQSLRWDNSIEEQFYKSKGRELPAVGPEYYAALELGFDPRAKNDEFEGIARDIDAQLGEGDAIGHIMATTALEYRDVVRMLAARGTPLFYAYSRKLYGSPKDKFPDGRSSVRDLGHVMYDILTKVDDKLLGATFERTLSAGDCATQLNERFARYFHDQDVHVQVDDVIIADAAAGSDYVKVRTGAKFSPRDIDILEVHEGWVHVATSLNGQAQPVAKWLAKGPPRTVAVQEGLAALLEIFTFRTYPRRARRLNDRVLAVDKAEDGASFIDVYDWFRTEGYDEEECFHNARRIFRGGVADGGAPFTKDACYCKGVVLNYAFIWSAIQHNRADLIPFLFIGKVAHEDVPVLARRVADGVIKEPRYLPPMFGDLNGLAIWMAYSTFFTQLGGEAIADYYGKLFAHTT